MTSKSAKPRIWKKFKIHKRTAAVVFCVVICPWILIAVPGTIWGGGGTSVMTVGHRKHGWPFVHLVSTHVKINKYWYKQNFAPNQAPHSPSLEEIAKYWADNFAPHVKPVQLDFRFDRDPFFTEMDCRLGFWSDPLNWPVGKSCLHLSPRYIGLGLNLLIVVLIACAIGTVCEYRIRRHHRLFKFSLKSLMIFTVLASIVAAWLVRIQLQSNTTANLNQSLLQLQDDDLLMVSFEQESQFPLVLSQLLNHGKFPWGATNNFACTKSGRIEIYLEDTIPQEFNQIVKLAKESGYQLVITVDEFTPKKKAMLCAFNEMNIVDLTIDLDAINWMDQMFDSNGRELTLKQAAIRVNRELDFKLDLPHLENLTLSLDSDLCQVAQLQIFIGLTPSNCSITGVSNEGAKFILETADQWPENMKLVFLSNVSADIREKIRARFKIQE